MPDKDYYFLENNDRIENAYKELIRNVVQDLGATSNDAAKFGTDIFHFERRIAEITPFSANLQNPTHTSHYRTLSELNQIVLNIPFYDILTAMFPDALINENTEVVITSDSYLTEIAAIVSTTDERTKNNYLIWRLVQKFLPYLNDKFSRILDNFNGELYGRREPQKRWETCIQLTSRLMGLALNVLDEKIEPIRNDTAHIVNEAFRSIVSRAKDRIKKFPHTHTLHNQLARKLANLRIQVGLPSHLKDATFLKNYYQDLSIIKSSLFDSVKNNVDFRKSLLLKRLKHRTEDDLIVESFARKQVTYLPAYNLIVVPKSLLISPYFEDKYPRSIIYGRLGVEIAEAVIDAILPYGSLWTSERKLLTAEHFTANESLRAIEEKRYCLYKFILKLNVALPYYIANETALQTLKHLAAVSITQEALLDHASGKHIHQPGLEDYEDMSLFFLAYGQTQCSNSTSQFQLYDNLVNFKLSHYSLLYIMWAQLPEFSKSFDCTFNKKVQCKDQL